jgi:hypothetical protein
MAVPSVSAVREAGPAKGGVCLHCASTVPPGGGSFCCAGCEHVYELLRDEGLARYYDLRGGAGVPIPTEKTTLVDDKWIDLVELELAAKAGLSPVQLDLEGLHCTGCVWLCEELFRRAGKPGRAIVNPALGTLDLWVERDFPLRDYVGHLASFGYRAGPRKRVSRRQSDLVVRMGVCIALAMNTMIFSVSLYAGLDDEGGSLRTLFHYINLALALGAFWIGGSLFVRGAWRALRRGMLHLDLPIALGLVLGYAGSIASLVFEGGRHAYFDTLVIFTALMLVGRYLRERVLEKNRAQLLEDAGIEGLLVRRVVDHGDEGSRVEVVPVTQLAGGHRLLLAPGDVAPVDARLVDAQASLSLEWITGESVPLEVSRDSLVTAGASNAGASAITVEATQASRPRASSSSCVCRARSIVMATSRRPSKRSSRASGSSRCSSASALGFGAGGSPPAASPRRSRSPSASSSSPAPAPSVSRRRSRTRSCSAGCARAACSCVRRASSTRPSPCDASSSTRPARSPPVGSSSPTDFARRARRDPRAHPLQPRGAQQPPESCSREGRLACVGAASLERARRRRARRARALGHGRRPRLPARLARVAGRGARRHRLRRRTTTCSPSS